jgi:hypothetical protein
MRQSFIWVVGLAVPLAVGISRAAGGGIFAVGPPLAAGRADRQGWLALARPSKIRASASPVPASAQQLTDSELFYVIEGGISWTAMPGWIDGDAEA